MRYYMIMFCFISGTALRSSDASRPSLIILVTLFCLFFQLSLVNSFARRLPRSEFDGRTLLLMKNLAVCSAKLESDKLADLGIPAVGERELRARVSTAAAAAASGVAVSGGDFGEGGSSSYQRGALSGLEVLWECLQDGAPEDERWVTFFIETSKALFRHECAGVSEERFWCSIGWRPDPGVVELPVPGPPQPPFMTDDGGRPCV